MKKKTFNKNWQKYERKSGERSDLSGQTAKQPSSDDHPLDPIPPWWSDGLSLFILLYSPPPLPDSG